MTARYTLSQVLYSVLYSWPVAREISRADARLEGKTLKNGADDTFSFYKSKVTPLAFGNSKPLPTTG